LSSQAPAFLYWFERERTADKFTAIYGKFCESTQWRWPKDQNKTRKGTLARRHPGTLAAAKDAKYDWKRLVKADEGDSRGEVWIGIRAGITPEELERKTCGGFAVPLGDGNTWRVPVLDISSPSLSIDYREVYLDSAWQQVPVQEHVPVCEQAMFIAGRYREAILTGAQKMDLPGEGDEYLRDFVAKVLAVNYELNIYEASQLELFGPAYYLPCVQAAIDWPSMHNVLVDLLSEGNGSTNPLRVVQDTNDLRFGERGSLTNTSQPALTPGLSQSNKEQEQEHE
jgi:hypothetical protein